MASDRCWWEEPPKPWTDAAALELIAWFRQAVAAGALPKSGRIQLQSGVATEDPPAFYAYLMRDVDYGSNAPRALTGAVLADLARLKELFGS